MENNKHEEYQYLNLVKDIIENGFWEEGRNGRTKSIFGNMMRFSLKDGKMPILTTKKTAWKTCLRELLWFVRGETDNNILNKQGVHIWDGNSTREFLDSRGLHSYPDGVIGPCFVEGTKVLTYDGYKNIEDVKNDKVYTHNGNFCKVLENMKRPYSGTLYKIKTKYGPHEIVCTPEHPFYVRKYIIKKRFRVNGIEKRNLVFADEPNFIDAKELVKGKYFLGMKIEETEVVPDFLSDNGDFWWMMGFYVASGCIPNEKSHVHFFVVRDEIEECLPKLLKMAPNLLLENENTEYKSYYFVNQDIANILKLFGKYADKKCIPDFIQKAPKHLITEFLNGYKNASTVSYDLIYGIQRLYFKLGKMCSIQFDKMNDTYLFKIPEIKSIYDYSFIDKGYIWLKIKNIEIENVVNRDVYNLSVIDDNTYTVNNIVVHNCYGYQWRNFNAKYDSESAKKSDDNVCFPGIDQLQSIIDQLKNPATRNSRRLIMTAWNPCQLDEMALPPCHILCQFNVHDGNKLSCAMTQRSVDTICGSPFNIASYSFLTHLLAKHCGLEAYEFVYFMGNCHIYEEHIEPAKLQMIREPYEFPTIEITELRDNINDYQVEDFKIHNYQSHDAIKVKMVA
jgi:thymidylate synthase